MPSIASSIRCVLIAAIGVALLIAISDVDVQALTVTVPLDAEADLTSNFNTYWSEGIAQLNLTYQNTTRQPFWNTNNLTQTYNNSFDFFPHDRAMKFGVLTYDDASLTSASGTAAITGLTLGIEKDPLNSSYVNGSWLSFSTDLTTYSGSVTVFNGAVTGIDLTANYTSLGKFGSTSIDASGAFTIDGDQFKVMASGYQPTLGAAYNPSMAWNWTGKILDLAQPPLPDDADFNGNGTVDAADYSVWRDTLGTVDLTPYTLGDANGDGQVTTDDYQIWKSQFGGPPPAGFASAMAPALAVEPVPEPVSTVGVIVATMAFGLRRSGRRQGRRP